MAFLIQCDNKKCFKLQASLLDPATDNVICSDCGQAIINVTKFAKAQLKSLGQIIKKTTVSSAWSVKCEHCNKHALPKLEKDKFFCTSCGQVINNINEFFKKNLMKALKENSDDNEEQV